MDGPAKPQTNQSLRYHKDFSGMVISDFLMILEQLQADLGELFLDGRLLEAARLRAQIDAYLDDQAAKELTTKQTADFQSCRKLWATQEKLHASIIQDTSLIEGLMKEWQTEESWEQGYSCKDYTVQYKQFPESSYYKFKLEGQVQCNLFQFCSVFNEINLFKLWIPYMMGIGLKASQEIARPSRLRVVAHVDIALPWPLSPRDLAIEGYGVDLLADSGKVMILLRNADESLCDIPKRNCPRVELISGGALLTPKGDNEIFVSFIFSVDPKIATIPAWLMNWGMKTFSGYFFTAMSDVAKGVGVNQKCPYQEKINSRPEFYQYLKERFEIWKAAPSHEKFRPETELCFETPSKQTQSIKKQHSKEKLSEELQPSSFLLAEVETIVVKS